MVKILEFIKRLGAALLRFAGIKSWFDRYIIDGLVNIFGHFILLLSALLRVIQSGSVRHYFLFVFISLTVLMFLTLRRY